MKKHSILIVEDEKSLQEAYKVVLSSQGYEVNTANNGIEGILKLKSAEPDLVLLDVFMPVMNGKEFLSNINLEDYPNTNIVVFSNLSDKDTEETMLKLGAKAFILKSEMSPTDLIDMTKQYLS